MSRCAGAGTLGRAGTLGGRVPIDVLQHQLSRLQGGGSLGEGLRKVGGTR